MLKSKQVQSMALSVAMLITLTAAAAIKLTVLPQEQELVADQVDVLALMSNHRELPVDLYVSP